MDMRNNDYIPAGVDILVDPDALYETAVSNIESLRSERVLCAENKQEDMGIYITLDSAEQDLQFDVVDSGRDVDICSTPVRDCDECISKFWKLVYDFLVDDDAAQCDELPEQEVPIAWYDGQDDIYDTVEEREGDLMDALIEFMYVLTGLDIIPGSGVVTSDELWDILDEILDVVATKHGFLVYRPMFVDDVLQDYPYNDLDEEAEASE